MIAAPEPGLAIETVQDFGDLGPGQERDEWPIRAFAGYRQNSVDDRQVIWVTNRCKPKEGSERG
jgi:hypothetical protein